MKRLARALLPFLTADDIKDPVVQQLILETDSSEQMQDAIEQLDAAAVASILLPATTYFTILLDAVQRNDVEAVRTHLYLAGTLPPGRRTALQTAASLGHKRITEILIPKESGR